VLGSLSVLACVLYLVPLVALVAVVRDDGDDALDLACSIGLVFAADFLGTFLLTYVFRVETAAFVRTAVLSAAVGVIAGLRSRRGRAVLLPLGPLSRLDLVTLLLAGGLAFAWSFNTSSQYWIWDREWHVPFTASLRAQHMPFHNVYDPQGTIRYHLSGDLFAALLQSLSFATMSASRALSLSHDLQSAIAGGMVALCLRALSRWSPVTAALASLVPLLAGPMTFHLKSLPAALGDFEGDSDFNNFTLSFRPHCMLAGVVLMAIIGHVVRLARDRRGHPEAGWGRVSALAPLVALGAICDEFSTALAGLALGALWVRWPDLLGTSRRRGVIVLGGLAAIAIAANLILAGTIAPGGPIEHARWVAPRLPRLAAPGWPLGFDLEAWKVLLADMGSVIIPGLVLGLLVWRGRKADDAMTPPALFVLGITAVGLVTFLCLEFNGRTFEGHRFATAGRFLLPVMALIYSARSPRASVQSVILLAPVLAGVLSTVGFVIYRLPHKEAVLVDGQYDTNCREELGARMGEEILSTYVDAPIWYRYAGCRPIFAAGHDGPTDVVLCGAPMLGAGGFAKMNRSFFSPTAPALVACGKDVASNTPLCKRARALASCAPSGSQAVVCGTPPSTRAVLASPSLR
jgi:hypothetical protein